MLKYLRYPEHVSTGLVPCQGQPAMSYVSCPAGWPLAGLQVNTPGGGIYPDG